MKRCLKIFLFSSLIFVLLTEGCWAMESNIDGYNKDFDIESIMENVDDETLKILNDIGITEISFDSIFSISPKKVINAFFNMVSLEIKENYKFLFVSLGVIIIKVLLTSFNNNETTNLVGDCILALSLTVPLGKIINLSFSVIEVLSNFTTAFAGAFCAIVSASGGAVLGASYSGITVFTNTFINAALKEISSPCINAMCSLGFLSAFDSFKLTSKISDYIKKIYVFILSFAGTVFSGLITIKGVLANGTDSLSSKGIRFVVGKSLPLVGGAVSEAYSSLVSGLALIKNTVGAFGIITVVIMVLPTVINLVLWMLFMDFLIMFSEALGDNGCGNILPTFKNVGVLLLSTISIITVIFIVNVGVVIAIRGGGNL